MRGSRERFATGLSARIVACVVAAMACALTLGAPSYAVAQDGAKKGSGRVSQEIFLDEEELDVEADLPSVDLVLSFKGLRYESIEARTTFFPELLETVQSAPF